MKNKWFNALTIGLRAAVMVIASLFVAISEEFSTVLHIFGWFGVVYFTIAGGYMVIDAFNSNDDETRTQQ